MRTTQILKWAWALVPKTLLHLQEACLRLVKISVLLHLVTSWMLKLSAPRLTSYIVMTQGLELTLLQKGFNFKLKLVTQKLTWLMTSQSLVLGRLNPKSIQVFRLIDLPSQRRNRFYKKTPFLRLEWLSRALESRRQANALTSEGISSWICQCMKTKDLLPTSLLLVR